MEGPGFAALFPHRTDEHQLRAAGIRPVVGMGPGGKGGTEGGGWAQVLWGDQGFDDFPGPGSDDPPGGETGGQCVHDSP